MRDLASLPNDCGIVGACALTQLDAYGVDSRPLRVIWKRADGEIIHHQVTVFEIRERVRVYDYTGTVTLPKHLRLIDSPNALAKSIGKIRGLPTPVKGEWVV